MVDRSSVRARATMSPDPRPAVTIAAIPGTNRDAVAPCFLIRRRVFCEEQAIAEDLEWDGLDSDCLHYLLAVDGVPVGTARLRPYGPGSVKIERVAVLRAHRGRGFGGVLMRAILGDVDRDARRAVLNAQSVVRGFYERLGFVAEGPEFLEADIPHVHMVRPAR
jgi:predicted GNAT family N-acyltransferase